MPDTTPTGLHHPTDADPIADWPLIIAELAGSLELRTPKIAYGRVFITPTTDNEWKRRLIAWDLSDFSSDVGTLWGPVRVIASVDDSLTTGTGAVSAMGEVTAGGAGDPDSQIGISLRRSSTTETEVNYLIVQAPFAAYKSTA